MGGEIPDFSGAIDSVMRGYVPSRAPGASIAASRGDFFFERSYGFANLEEKIPAANSTKYMAASVTKQFVCAIVMKLASAGKIDVDGKISKYFTELPEWADKVTPRNLMNHSSGVPDYFDGAFMKKYCEAGEPCRDDEALRIISSYGELMFEPGSEHMYSNSGYVLLGGIIERVCGEKFSRAARDLLLIPSGMSGASFLDSGDRPDDMAIGYWTREGAQAAAPFNRGVAGWADGNLCCTAGDLHRWHKALLGGAVMDPASYAEATSPLTLPDGRDTGAGLGWFSGTRGGLREVWHTGSTPGYRCRVSRFTNLPGGGSAAVIIMCNADSDMTDDFGDLSAEVIHILLGDLLSPYEREEGPLPPIEGRYSSDIGENLFCDVSMIGGEISLRGSVRCIRSGAAAYRIKALDGGLRFAVRGPSDVTVWFGGGCMAICDVGRMTYLTRREG